MRHLITLATGPKLPYMVLQMAAVLDDTIYWANFVLLARSTLWF